MAAGISKLKTYEKYIKSGGQVNDLHFTLFTKVFIINDIINKMVYE
ncbi:MAG: hypothetical protein GX660_12380 [Clostridiaceae bacterium]|nr:hypothetical protein [Clostridiaceae bacterium]